jgi:hypothetical protein
VRVFLPFCSYVVWTNAMLFLPTACALPDSMLCLFFSLHVCALCLFVSWKRQARLCRCIPHFMIHETLCWAVCMRLLQSCLYLSCKPRTRLSLLNMFCKAFLFIVILSTTIRHIYTHTYTQDTW